MKKSRNISLIVISVFLIALGIFSACSDILAVDITVSYPFEGEEAERYSINVDDAMQEADQAINNETTSIIVEEIDASGDIPVEVKGKGYYEIQYNTPVNLDMFLQLVDGQTVNFSATLVVDGSVSEAVKEKIPSEVEVPLTICKFKTKTTFQEKNVLIEIKQIDTYCRKLDNGVQVTEADKPYFRILHKNEPYQIMLSENEDLQEYLQYKNKIKSATINTFSLKFISVPDGFEAISNIGESEEVGSSKLTIRSDLFAKAVADSSDFYKNDETTRENYWVGTLVTRNNEGFKAGSSFDLLYTYDGKYILQKAIKEIDFELGVKSLFIIRPGSQRPSGVFEAEIEAEFFFSVEPLD